MSWYRLCKVLLIMVAVCSCGQPEELDTRARKVVWGRSQYQEWKQLSFTVNLRLVLKHIFYLVIMMACVRVVRVVR
jgi:hypothetical protein